MQVLSMHTRFKQQVNTILPGAYREYLGTLPCVDSIGMPENKFLIRPCFVRSISV
jgi:hypothetical protein